MGWSTTKDDAFITFRYAEHLASGDGLVWNIGEPPVEGYTNFLFLLLMALFALFGADLVIAAKLVSLLSALGIFLLLILIMEKTYRDRFATLFVLFLYAFPYFTAAHVAGGLETMFFTLILTAAAYVFLLQLDEHRSTRHLPLSLLLLGLGLTRPEGVLVACLFIILQLALMPGARRKSSLTPYLYGFVLPGLFYMLFRLSYFRHFLPNPFYIKRAESMFSPVGLLELGDFFLNVKFVVGLVLVAFLAPGQRKKMLALAAVFLPGLAVYIFFKPMMNYAFRYYYPYYPLLLPVMAAPVVLGRLALVGVVGRWSSSPPTVVSAGAFSMAVFTLLLCPNLKDNYTQFRYWQEQGSYLRRCHILIGKMLAKASQYKDLYVALGDVGAIPYYSGWKVIDMGGLNDEHLAREGKPIHRPMRAFTTKLDLDYVFGKNPAVFILSSSKPLFLDDYVSHAISEDPRFEAYQRLLAYKYSDLHYLIIYLRKGPSLAGLRRLLVDEARKAGAEELEVP